MAYDADLAERVREILAARRGIEEKKMFGGLAFMIDGNMSVVVSSHGGLMVRVPTEETDRLLTRNHVAPMVMAGRETRGWVRVQSGGVKTSRQLSEWVNRGVEFAEGLPAK
ncbi:TfoX/Sxy family protein [Mycolicibacterium hippocampi]|uniref:TfoX/Sxy family protein n=1 Tax=Mycolicibacterium hippocampi TaxID=659824 RepID=UPI0035163008